MRVYKYLRLYMYRPINRCHLLHIVMHAYTQPSYRIPRIYNDVVYVSSKANTVAARSLSEETWPTRRKAKAE